MCTHESKHTSSVHPNQHGIERKNVLFGTLSYDISSKRKRSGWESVSEAFNAGGSEKRTQAEVKKKKWSDIKVDVKRRLAAHRRSVANTGGGAACVSEQTLSSSCTICNVFQYR